MAFVNERTELGKYITIDRDLGITLVYLGQGGPDNPTKFDLFLGEKKISFQAMCRTSRTSSGGHGANWDVIRLSIPPDLETKQNEIVSYINDALDAFGISANRENVEFVKVNFITPNF